MCRRVRAIAMASSSYYRRVTSQIPATMAAHPSWSEEDARRFLRGHGAPGQGITPEHGGAGRGRRIGQQRGRVEGKPGGPQVRVMYRDADVARLVNQAVADKEYVQINTHTKAEGWQILGQSKAYGAKHVQKAIEDNGGNV